MNILNYFNEWIDKFKILKWPKSDRENLFRILLEIYNSDGTFSEDEKSDFKRRSFGVGINEEETKQVDFEKAISVLKLDNSKMELIHFWIATSLFADDDFDAIERTFIDNIISKYGLNEIKLRSIIKTIRDKKIDVAVNQWYLEIEPLLKLKKKK